MTPALPTPPIFVDDHGDVSVFRSVPFAESWMEPIDIENREYTAYDAAGRLLALSADRRRCYIALAEQEPTHSAELLERLRKFLRAVKDPVGDDPTYDLPRLVTHFDRYADPRS